MESKGSKLSLLVDFGNTLSQMSYEEAAKATYDKLSEIVSKIHAPELSGYASLLSEKVKKESGLRAAYLQTFTDFYGNLHKSPELDGDVSLTAALREIIKKLCGKSDDSEDLHKLCETVAKDEKCLTAGYTTETDAKETLEVLKKLGHHILIYSTMDSTVVKAVAKKFALDTVVDGFIVAGEPGCCKDKATLLENAIAGLLKEVPKYRICVVGDMLETDMQLARKHNVRSIWYSHIPWSEARNNAAITLYASAVDGAVSDFLQLPHLVGVLEEDAAYLEGKKAGEDYRKEELPSRKRLRVGYHFPPKKIKEMARKNFIASNDKLLFFPIQLNASLDLQGPFDAFLHKCSDLLIEEFVKNKSKRFTTLREYTEKHEKTMVTIDPLRIMKVTLYRTETNDAIGSALASSQAQSVMKKYGIRMRLPYSRKMKNESPEASLDAVKKDISTGQCNYSFMLKLSESCQTADSHTLAIATNEEGLRKALALDLYKGKELIVQQLVKHNSTLYKLYTLGADYITFQCKKSLPSKLPIAEYAVFDSQKPFPKEWFTGKEEAVDKFNKDYGFEMTRQILQHTDLSVIGLDFIIEEVTGDYVVIDLNYYSSFRHEKDLSKQITNHITKTYNAKIKGIH